jgi:hypothetical protein
LASLGTGHPSRETLSEYHDGELDPQTRAEVRRHVLECVACQDYLEDLRSGSSLYQRLPAVRPPTSLRHEMYRRIDAVEEHRRRRFWLPFPSAGPNAANAVGLVVVALFLAFLVPQVVGAWSVFAALSGRAPQSAAQSAAPPAEGAPTGPAFSASPTEAAPESPLVAPRVTVVPPTPEPPTPEPPTPPPSATARPAAPTAPPRPAAPQGQGQGQLQGQGAPTQGGPPPPATATRVPPPPTATVVAATPTAPATPTTAQRVVAGQISAVDRRQRVFSVFSRDGNRTWQVRLADGTTVVQRDGQALTFEEVGLADQVEVTGTEVAQSPGTVVATSVRVLVSAVAPAGGKKGRVLFLLDGAEDLHPPRYGYTGDWIRRLNDTGYAVTALEPARISSGQYDLKDVDLIVVGYPATLSPSALQLVTGSHKPVLDAEPRLVQALGLGLNVDPQQPARDVPGRSVEIAGQVSPVTGGLNGETVLAAGTLHRIPIVASGAVLASVVEGGQRRAVWSASGRAMYLGVYASDGGQNHNPTYWALFDRAVLWLLGRDPTPVVLP